MAHFREHETRLHPKYEKYDLSGIQWEPHPTIVNQDGQPLPVIKGARKAGAIMNNLALGPREVEKLLAEASQSKELPPAFGMNLLGMLFVVINTKEDILNGLSRPDIFLPSIFQTRFFAPFIGEGPPSSLGEQHDLHKATYNRVFMTELSKLQDALVGILPNEIEKIITQLKQGDFNLAEMNTIIGKSTFELIFAGEFSDQEKKFLINFVDKVFAKAPLGALLPEGVMKVAAWLYFRKNKAHGLVDKVVERRILSHLRTLESPNQPDITDRFVEEYLQLKAIQPDTHAEKWEEAVSHQPALAEVRQLVLDAALSAMAVSFDNTSAALKAALVELSLNPDILQELYQEYRSHQAPDTLRPTQFPKLLSFIYALLQKWSPTSKTGKHLAQETMIAGYTLPADTEVLLNLWKVGRGNEEQYLNDHTPLSAFYPSQELGGAQLMRALANLPMFGQQVEKRTGEDKIPPESGRECPGRLLALHILFKFLTEIITHFEAIELRSSLSVANKSTLHLDGRVAATERVGQ
ncbi:MAG TPA: cytochrome P450 [Patescibacteria group bacterium]